MSTGLTTSRVDYLPLAGGQKKKLASDTHLCIRFAKFFLNNGLPLLAGSLPNECHVTSKGTGSER